MLAVGGAEHPGAESADDLLARPPRDPLGGPVERGDPAVLVDGEDPVRHVVEDDRADARIEVHWPTPCWSSTPRVSHRWNTSRDSCRDS